MINKFITKKPKIHNGKKTFSSIKQNNETGPLSYNTYKNPLYMDQNLNVRLESIKLPEENMGDKFSDVGLGNDFFRFDAQIYIQNIQGTSTTQQ